MKTYEEMVQEAIEMLENDDDLFCDMVEELDRTICFADGYRCIEMFELDSWYFGCKATALINDLTEDFNINDDYFFFSIDGLESTDDKVDLYRSKTSSSEVFDNLLEHWDDIDFINDDEFNELMTNIKEF